MYGTVNTAIRKHTFSFEYYYYIELIYIFNSRLNCKQAALLHLSVFILQFHHTHAINSMLATQSAVKMCKQATKTQAIKSYNILKSIHVQLFRSYEEINYCTISTQHLLVSTAPLNSTNEMQIKKILARSLTFCIAAL